MLGAQRLIVRRVRPIGAQAELWPDRRHHAFLTNRTDAIETVEAEHQRCGGARDPRPLQTKRLVAQLERLGHAVTLHEAA